MTEERRGKVHLALDPENCPEAIAYFERMKDADSVPSYQLASDLVNCDKDKDMPRELFGFIVSLYEDSISKGNTDAMNDLGALYYDGRGCCQDFAKAVHYYTMAAEHGHELATENLGYCYYYGRSIPVDYEKAFQCFARGAFTGRLVSLYKIGDMYRKGYFVDKNPEEAFKIYERCLELMTGHDEWYVAGPVYLRLGYMYLDGFGTEKDAFIALKCFQEAECFLYNMVADCDVMYTGSLKASVSGQERARSELAGKLHVRSWP
ncbi:MAG: sel1 repeat family protein [Synergistaceae bacterium]|nr:sel1 repeat family protein [Synergistaceae bacterium]